MPFEPNVQSLLTIEASLTDELLRTWLSEEGEPALSAIGEQVRNGRFDLAEREIDRITFRLAPGQGRRIELAAASAFLLGASHFAFGPENTEQARGAPFPMSVQIAASQLSNGLATNGAQALKDSLKKLLAKAEQALGTNSLGLVTGTTSTVVPGLMASLRRTSKAGARTTLGLGANLTVTKLVALGSVTQAVANGVDEYQVTEVLDGVTCPVCRRFHGSVFDAGAALATLSGQLLTDDPLALKAAYPFPNQNQEGLEELVSLSRAEKEDRGWIVPPFHLWCRGQLVPVGTVPNSEILGFAEAGSLPGELA